jgi:hypothetical protein
MGSPLGALDMTAVSPERRSTGPSVGVIGPLLGGSLFGALFFLGAWVVGAPTTAERRLCDSAVASMLHSKDLVEVQRAGIIIHELIVVSRAG